MCWVGPELLGRMVAPSSEEKFLFCSAKKFPITHELSLLLTTLVLMASQVGCENCEEYATKVLGGGEGYAVRAVRMEKLA